jgi:hypothetical protein
MHKDLIALIQFKRGLASKWVQKNPVLETGEPGYEEDTGKFKLGDGIRTWTQLPYAGGQIEGLLATVEELNRLHGAIPGTAVAGKVLVVDNSKNINFDNGSITVNNITLEGNLIGDIDGGTP